MSVPDFVVRQVAQAIGGVISETTGKGVAGAVVGAVLVEAEGVNLINNLHDGTATVTDILAVTVALDAALLGAGIALTGAGLIAGIGVSIPIAAAAVMAGAAYVWYDRNSIAIQDSADILIDAIKRGEQPWNFIPRIVDAYSRSAYKRNVMPDVNENWHSATTWRPRRDPLAIDLDGDGIETVGVPSSGTPVLFDHNADGIRTGTGWLSGDDAWLVLDRDGNGTIDSGRELFGVDSRPCNSPATRMNVDIAGWLGMA